ncbi:MAG: hypothetical protein HOP29_13605 [Phycisphaerales bacterium]|nr:hypothetical protein [Phycisphaerales bacterium]
MRSRILRIVTGLLIGALLVGGCGDGKAATDGAGEVEGVVKTAEMGPVQMTVSVDRGEITIADRLKLRIEVTAEEGVEARMPSFGEQMDAFGIRDFHETSAEAIEGGKRRWVHEYDLDIFLSGDYAVPALTATFTDARKGAEETIESSVTTDGFDVKVKSLAEGEFDPTKIRDVKGPVALPADPRWTLLWWGLGVVGGGAIVVGCAAWLIRRSRRPGVEWVAPAHEWAFAELHRLANAKLIEKGMVHEFYFRLSMIVREYIERRFQLTAPEWTTEEFLVHLRRSDALPAVHRDALEQFLQRCDMVKFALYEPTTAEIEGAFNAARDFVQKTAFREGGEVTRAAA